MIRLDNLNVFYGLVQSLHNVNLRIENGECVALLGSNGAGKSTMLNTISGLVKTASGHIFFCDEPIDKVPAGKRTEFGIVQVPEGGRPFPHLTVSENLLMGASARKDMWKARNVSLKQVWELFPILKELGSLQARFLSGGERQMVAIGRALMARPRLLMIDEPSIGLAPKIMTEIYTTLKTLHDGGTTILLSEQNVQQALGIAQRGYVLENGHVVIEGASEDILASEHIKKAYLGL